MEERKWELPDFPELYTPSDAERLEQLQLQADKLKDIYHAHFHDPVWETKPWIERFGRRLLDPPRRYLPGLDRIVPHLTPETMREERYRIEEEMRELDRYRHAQERAPEIMDEMLALAIGGNFVEDRTNLFQLFPDSRRFPDEMLDHLLQYGMILAKSDPKDLLSGDYWDGTAPTREIDYRDYWQKQELSPQHILSSIAFSEDVEQIRQALMYAYPPSPALAIPEDVLGEEWYKGLEELFKRYKLNFDRENPEESLETLSLIQLYTNGVPHSLLNDDGTPLLDINGEPLQGRLYPALGDIETGDYFPATVWYGDELLGVYDEGKKEFVPWSFATMQPYATEEDQEDIHWVKSVFHNIANLFVMYGYGVRVATPVFFSGLLADVLTQQGTYFPAQRLTNWVSNAIANKITGLSTEEREAKEKELREASNMTALVRMYDWMEDKAEELVEWGVGEAAKGIDAQMRWWEESKLPVMAEAQVPMMDMFSNEGVWGTLTNVPYMAHILTESVSSMAVSMGTMVGVTALTKNPALGKITSGYLIGAAETSRVVQILHEEGIPDEDIATWTAALLPILGSLEVAGAMIMLRAVAPRMYHDMFGRQMVQQLVRGTMREMARRGLKTYTVTHLSEVLIETAVQTIGNAVLHQEGIIELDEVATGAAEVACRTFFSFLIPSAYGGFTHAHYLHQNFVEAGLYDTFQEKAAMFQEAGFSEEMSQVLSALQLVETTEGAKAKAKTFRQLEPVFRQAARSPELINTIHQVEGEFANTFAKEQAIQEQIDNIKTLVKKNKQVLERTKDPAKIEKRQAAIEQAESELTNLRSEREAISAHRETLVTQLSHLDYMALQSGLMTSRLWDTRPADARKIYLEDVGVLSGELGSELVELAWDALPQEVQLALQDHRSERAVEAYTMPDPTELTPEQSQQLADIQKQIDDLMVPYEPLAKELVRKEYQRMSEALGSPKRIILNEEIVALLSKMRPTQKKIFKLLDKANKIAPMPPITPVSEIRLTHSELGVMPEADQNRVRYLLSMLEDTLRFDIREIRIDTNLPDPGFRHRFSEHFYWGVYGAWLAESRTLVLMPNFDDSTFYHEVAHAMSSIDINEGRFDLWTRYEPAFAKEMKAKIAELRKQGRIIVDPEGGVANLLYQEWLQYRDAEEYWARAFAAYHLNLAKEKLTMEDEIAIRMFGDMLEKDFTIGRALQEHNLARKMLDVDAAIEEHNRQLAIREEHRNTLRELLRQEREMASPREEMVRQLEHAIEDSGYRISELKRGVESYNQQREALDRAHIALDRGEDTTIVTPVVHPDPVVEIPTDIVVPPGKRWEVDQGAMPGEPMLFLDVVEGQPLDSAKAAIIIEDAGDGMALFQVRDREGRLLGKTPTLDEAVKFAENRFPLPPPPPSDIPPITISPDQFPFDPSNGLAKLPSIEAILAQRTLAMRKNPDLQQKLAMPIDILLMDDKSLSYRDMSTLPGLFRKWFKGHLDSKYILMNMEARTGRPFYTLYDLMRQVHGQVEHASRLILKRLSKVPDFQTIINDDTMLSRVEQLIASKNPKFKVQAPDNITHLEQEFARAVEEIFESYRPKINVLAFEKAYEHDPGNVDAIMNTMLLDEQYRQTVEIAVKLTNRGEIAKRDAYIMDQDWGVIEGYTPWMTVVEGLNRSSREYGSRRRGEGRLKHRYGVEIPDMTNTLTERIEQYVRQVESQWQLRQLLDTFETHLQEVAPKIDDSGTMYDEMSRFIQELQHFPPPESHSGGNHFIQRIYATVSPAMFHTNARVLLRNFFQFVAFHPWRTWLPKGMRARHIVDHSLYEKAKLYYDSTVSQLTGIQRSIFFHGTKPLYANWPLVGKPMYNLVRLLNRVAPYGKSDDIPRHWSFNTGMVRAYEAIRSYREHGNVERLIREAGIEVLRRPQQDLFLQYVGIGDAHLNMGIEGLQQVTGYEAAAMYLGKEVADLTHFNYERAFRAPIEMGTAGRTLFNLLTFTRSYWTRHFHNAYKWANRDWAEQYTPRQRLMAFKDSLAMIMVGGIISSYLRELYGRPYRSYWIGDILYWELGGLMLGAVNQLGSAVGSIAEALDPHTEEDRRWRAVRAVTRFFLNDANRLFVPFAANFLDALEAGAMRGHLPEQLVDHDLRAYQAIRSAIDDKYTPAEIEVMEIELMDAILKGIFNTPPPELDRVVEAQKYLEDRRQELGVAYFSEPGKVGQIYTISNLLSDIETYIRKQNIPRDMVTQDTGFHPLIEFGLDFLNLLDDFHDIPTQPPALRREWRRANPEFELLLIFWERYELAQVPYGSAAGQQIAEALRTLDGIFEIPAHAARDRFTNWRYAIIQP